VNVAFAGVDAFYGRSQILHGVSLGLPEGKLTAILGRNGVGKTTLLKTLMGMLDHMTGSIRLGTREIGQEPTFRRARAGIAYVPQGRQIIPDFTIRENILMGAFARRARRGASVRDGKQQQLAIARALAADPKVLLLDEPSEGIQPNVVDDIERIIMRLNQEFGMTVLLVEQNVAFVRRAGHRFAMMEKGRVVAGGAINELTDELVHRHMAV